MTVTMNHNGSLDLSIIRAQIVQRELAHKYQREDWLPYIWEAMDRLDTSSRQLIDAGRSTEAEYWLLCAERFAGVISQRDYSERVLALGPIFEADSPDPLGCDERSVFLSLEMEF